MIVFVITFNLIITLTGEHLIENKNCFENYDLNKFGIVSKARSDFQ